MDEDYFDTMVSEERSNSTFWRVAIVLAAIVIITVAGIALWMFVLSPAQQESRDAEATETAAALTQTALAQVPTETLTPWPSDTPRPTSTSTPEPPAQVSTETPTVTTGPTATFTPTPTALPDTGFIDDFNLPGLVILGLILVMITFATRQIRASLTN
jgi:cytoskeletal protein RodZ